MAVEESESRQVDDAAITIAALPLEMLVKVFHQVDSVTLKRAERVCLYWQSVLLGTPTLQKSVLINTQRLANAPWQVSVTKRLVHTMDALLKRNTMVQTICITGESDTSMPWLGNHASPYALQLDELLPSLRAHFDQKDQQAAVVISIVLRNVTLVGRTVWPFIEGLAVPQTNELLRLHRVELDEVKVQNLDVYSCYWNRRWTVRCISGRITFASAASPLLVQLATVLCPDEPPLTPDEEAEYDGVVHWNDGVEFLGRQFTASQVKNTGALGLPPFLKRLIMAYLR